MHAFWEANVDGVHDMGGMHGFGPVVREADEPVFHTPWERVVYAMVRSARLHGIYNIDESRHAIERMPPAEYLSSSYYERWLHSLTTLVVEKGLTTEAEIERRMALFDAEGEDSSRRAGGARGPATGCKPRAAAGGEAATATGGGPSSTRPTPPMVRSSSSFRPETAVPRFHAGDPVVTITTRTAGHTRLPRYARGKHGVVDSYRGFHVFPDSSAHDRGEAPQPLYSVRFESPELWGPGSDPSGAVYLDLWESYLEPANG